MNENEKLSMNDLEKATGGDRGDESIVVIGPGNPQPNPPIDLSFKDLICPICRSKNVKLAGIEGNGPLFYCYGCKSNFTECAKE